jgi:outer membrane protein assembly factor BamB
MLDIFLSGSGRGVERHTERTPVRFIFVLAIWQHWRSDLEGTMKNARQEPIGCLIQEGYDAAQTFVVKGAQLRFPLRVLWKYPCESLADWKPAPATKYSKKKTSSGPLLRTPRLPFVDGDRVVFTDGGIYGIVDGAHDAPATFHCLEGATGKKLWSRLHDIPGLLEIEGIAAGSMIVHRWWEEKPSLRAFSVADAREVWSQPGWTLSSNLIVVEEDILAVIADGAEGSTALMRLDGTSGAVRWSLRLAGGHFAIAADHGSIYLTEVRANDNSLPAACYSFADGTKQWAVELDGATGPIDAAMSPFTAAQKSLPRVSRVGVADGKLYISFVNTAVVCLDAASGKFLWAFADFQIGSLFTTILMNDAVCTTSSLGQGEHTYCRIDPRTGKALLRRMLPLAQDSRSPAACAVDNTILFPRGELCALAADTGETLWRSEVGVFFPTEDDVYDSFSEPRVAGGRVYAFRGGDCCLYCFG